MRRWAVSKNGRLWAVLRAFACCLFSLALATAATLPPPKKPKLLLAIIIDQFRYDYLLRFRADYHYGLKRLLERGAVFANAHYMQSETSTAPGHATILTGAPPSLSGIISDAWYDRELGQYTTSVFLASTKVIGGLDDDAGSTPYRLLVSTIGDEVKKKEPDSRVIGVSWKDRSAILPAGRSADAAYWYDPFTDHWVTSSYYRSDLPAWINQLNGEKVYQTYSGRKWLALDSHTSTKPFCVMATEPGVPECWLPATPWANDMLEQLAEGAIAGERLGHHAGTDVLTVSFSANDLVGHEVGPDDPKVREMCRRTDAAIGKLLDYVDRQVGVGNAVVVLTSDHGVATLPEANQGHQMPAGRVTAKRLAQIIDQTLVEHFGSGKWVLPGPTLTPYLNLDLIKTRKLDADEVERVAAEALRAEPHVAAVYTRHDMLAGRALQDAIGRAVSIGFYGPSSGDLFIVLDPYYVTSESGAEHGSPYDYDSHVPLIFAGPHIKAGKYDQSVVVNDVAPTLAALLRVDEPSGSIGRVLKEILK
jgi:predicted AlkP superfamily pyrophosphatase or phosphodiesterase